MRNHLRLSSSLGRCPASASSTVTDPRALPHLPKFPGPRSPPAAASAAGRALLSCPGKAGGSEGLGRSSRGSGRGSPGELPEGWGADGLNPSQARGKQVVGANGASRGAALRTASLLAAGSSCSSRPAFWLSYHFQSWGNQLGLGKRGTGIGVQVGARAGLLTVSDSRKRTGYLVNCCSQTQILYQTEVVQPCAGI